MIPLGNIHHFTSEEAQMLLHNKFVVILGDSIHRAIYKDMIYFLQKQKMLTINQLKLKAESFANDCLVEGGERHNKTSYCEARQYRTDHHLVRFYFITRIYSAYIESVLSDFNAGPPPDVVIINSCLWDLNRYSNGVSNESKLETAFREYWQNLDTLLGKLKDVLPTECLVIWNTAMPLGQKVQRAYLESGMKNQSTPVDILKANFYGATMACCYNFDVLDLHYCFRFLESKLDTDGVHWDGWVHRYITKLLLTHVANAWGVELKKKRKVRGIECNRIAVNQPGSPWLPPPPHLRPRLPPPPHLRPRLPPPPHLRPRLPLPPHLWPQPSPPAPHMFQSCSQFDDGFPPLQFSPRNTPTFQCDFTSDHIPLDEFFNWEDDQLPQFHPEDDQLSQFHPQDDQLSQFHPQDERVPQFHPQDERLPLFHPEDDRLPQFHPEDDRLPQFHPEDDRLPRFHPEDDRLPLFHPEDDQLPQFHPEDDQLPRFHPEEMWHNGFCDPGPVAPNAQLFTPYFPPAMPRGGPRRHHNDLIMRRRQPFRRQRGAAPYTVSRFERPPFHGWGPSY